MADLDQLLQQDGAVWRSHVDTKRPEIRLEDERQRAESSRAERWRAPLFAAAAVLLIAVTVSLIFVRGSDRGTHVMNAVPTKLSGRWAVTRIEVGSAQMIAVPRDQGAEFLWTPAGPQRV